MITNKDEHSIRDIYRTPESPLDLLIAQDDPFAISIPLDAEVAIFLADFAIRFPAKWPTVKEHIRDSRSNANIIARRLRISPRTVMRHLSDLRSYAKKKDIRSRRLQLKIKK